MTDALENQPTHMLTVRPRGREARGRSIVTASKKQRFLELLAQTCNVTKACELAGLNRLVVYQLRDRDPEFERLWQKALKLGAEALEDEATRRAMNGTARPIYQQGKLVGHEVVYSDRLMEMRLRSEKPEKYRDNALPGL